MTPKADLLDYVRGWAVARQAELTVRREMSAYRCTEQERGDPTVGDFGRPACYQLDADTHDPSDWCEDCRQREPLFHHLQSLRRESKLRLRRLQRAALRAAGKERP